VSEDALWLVGNVGAEEARSGAMHPHAVAVARLLALCLPARGQLLLPDGERRTVSSFWPDALGDAPEEPAFPWLSSCRTHAWFPNAETDALLRSHERGPLLPPAAVVAAVHDKAFTERVCEAEDLAPRPLRGLSLILEPEELAAPEIRQRLQAHVDAWPEWIGGRFALKPRLGSSGRGRVPGEAGRLDVESVQGALPRLAARGGAILEPWLDREQDLSVQLHVARDGDVTLLATLVQHMSPAGVYRGHSGRVDHRGRVTSGTQYDDGLLEAALALSQAARAKGFHGPCGVDAFTFHGPERLLLRPAVEFNARFTTGTLVASLLRRALSHIGPRIGLAPGEPRFFHFALEAPEDGWPAANPGRLEVVPLLPALRDLDARLEPALVFAHSAELLDDAIRR
jgi:hypothetical protein